jgi:hypothetical protein
MSTSPATTAGIPLERPDHRSSNGCSVGRLSRNRPRQSAAAGSLNNGSFSPDRLRSGGETAKFQREINDLAPWVRSFIFNHYTT